MDREVADFLVGELERRPPLTEGILPNREDLVELLASTDVPDSKRFYKVVNDNGQTIPDEANSQTHIVAVRRILRNDLALDYKKGVFKGWYDIIASGLGAYGMGVYDSDLLTRRLRADKRLAALMQKACHAGHPHSLLGKLETYDKLNRKTETRPLLVIPGVRYSGKGLSSTNDLSYVINWELSNRRPSADRMEARSATTY